MENPFAGPCKVQGVPENQIREEQGILVIEGLEPGQKVALKQ